MPYDYAVDMWSIGCTLYELYTGKILFTGDSNNQMLKAIMEIRGKFSPKLYKRGQLSQLHFDDLGNFISVEQDKVLDKVCRYFIVFCCCPTLNRSFARPRKLRVKIIKIIKRSGGCFYFCTWLDLGS